MKESIESLVANVIANSENGELDPRLENYINYKTKYIILRSTAKIEIEIDDGRVFKIDVTDYFEDLFKKGE